MEITKRQREILDFVNGFIEKHSYSPSINEIGGRLKTSSPATVHQHLKNLEGKGMIKRKPNRHRSIEVIPSSGGELGGVNVPILGIIAAGYPIESYTSPINVALPREMGADENCYLLRVAGD